MIEINTIAAPRTSGTGGTGGGTSATSSKVNLIKTGVQGVYLWGRYHDHTHDIKGDLDYVTNINATGNISTEGDITTELGTVSAPEGTFNTLQATGATISELHTNNIYNTGTVKTNSLSAVTSYINSLTSDNMVVSNLTVTKAAHFFKLIIDEIKSAQGMFILSPGNASLDHVGEISDGVYRCFFRTQDPTTGEYISNTFEQYDQVVCETFNAASGTTYDASNKWYWMLCTSTGTTTTVPFISDSVNDIFLNNFDTDEDGLISIDEFNDITDISTYFSAATGTFTEMAFLASVSALTDSAFMSSHLTRIDVSESVETIGNAAFADCEYLTELNLPTQLTDIGDYVFSGCSRIPTIIILRGNSIGDGCFSGCTNLTYLQLPEGIDCIDDMTLAGCSSVETLVIPSTVSAITQNAFSGITKLKEVYMKPETPPTVITDENVNDLFIYNTQVKDIYIPTGSLSAYTDNFLYSYGNMYEYTYEEIGTGTQATATTMDYHYFDLNTEDKDAYSNSVPEEGDSVAILGNRYDSDRQNAIMMSAYNIAWLDEEIAAPFITQYANINDYDLSSHRLNVISNGLNEFIGHFKVIVSGGTQGIEDYIAENSGMEIITDSDAVYFMTDREGYITSLNSVKGLPTVIYVRIGNKRIPILEWDNNSYIKFNGNNETPLREGKEE